MVPTAPTLIFKDSCENPQRGICVFSYSTDSEDSLYSFDSDDSLFDYGWFDSDGEWHSDDEYDPFAGMSIQTFDLYERGMPLQRN